VSNVTLANRILPAAEDRLGAVEQRRRVAQELAAGFAVRAPAHDRDASFPFENFDRLRRVGLLGLTVPVDFGGGGAGLAEAAAVVRIIAGGEPSTALVLALHYIQHGLLARARGWPPLLYERVARDAVGRGGLINALRVEPELGTPARGGLPATLAKRVEDGWRLSGHKIYCTGAPILRWLTVWARTEEDAPRVGFWLVPASASGIRIIETWDHLGMRATGSHDIVLDDVFVPAEHAVDIRSPSDWTAPDAAGAAWNTLIIASLYHGIAAAARDWLGGYLARRVPSNLGAPLSSLPRVEEAFGEIEALLYAADTILASALDRADGGASLAPSEPGLIKVTVTDHASRAVERAMSLIGNAALARSHPLERHYRDVLCGRIHTPQNDTALIAAGRAALARLAQETTS
jgi:alkylation response protein AidB-like acyl-CoA dehydrogenase